jgi:hypothetical protein
MLPPSPTSMGTLAGRSVDASTDTAMKSFA